MGTMMSTPWVRDKERPAFWSRSYKGHRLTIRGYKKPVGWLYIPRIDTQALDPKSGSLFYQLTLAKAKIAAERFVKAREKK